MQIYRSALTTAFAFICTISSICFGNSAQSIEVVNDSSDAIHISAQGNNHLSFQQSIPAYSKLLVVIQLTKLKSAQDKLFEAILNNSTQEVYQAILAGANVNLERDGKSPLLWAVLLKKPNAAKCLLDHGAL